MAEKVVDGNAPIAPTVLIQPVTSSDRLLRQERVVPPTRELYVTQPVKAHLEQSHAVAKTTQPLREQDRALAALQEQVRTLFDAIKHGDEAHQAWLKQALFDHFAGRPVHAKS
jgi:hypothetical protein